jgi:hypothetical protein
MTNDDTTNDIFLSPKTTPIYKGYKNTKGSIYANKDFQNGSVFKEGKVVANNVGLRYNVQEEEIELKKNANSSSTVANVIKADQSIHVRILNEAFVYLVSPDKNQKAGYFMVMSEGSKLTIYKKIIKNFVEGKKSVNSYSRDVPDTFKEKEQLYIVSNTGSLTKLPNGKGKRKKLFASKEAEMKSFIDSNNLSIRKESDFYKAVSYYNTL